MRGECGRHVGFAGEPTHYRRRPGTLSLAQCDGDRHRGRFRQRIDLHRSGHSGGTPCRRDRRVGGWRICRTADRAGIGRSSLGPDRTREDFVWYFGVCLLGVGISMILVLFNKRSPTHSHHTSGWHPIEFLRTVRRYWPGAIMVVTFAFGACMTVPFVFLANYADQLPNADLGPFFTVYASVGLIVRLGLRSWPDQFGPNRVMMAGMGLFAVGNWTFLLATPEQAWWTLVAGGIVGRRTA